MPEEGIAAAAGDAGTAQLGPASPEGVVARGRRAKAFPDSGSVNNVKRLFVSAVLLWIKGGGRRDVAGSGQGCRCSGVARVQAEPGWLCEAGMGGAGGEKSGCARHGAPRGAASCWHSPTGGFELVWIRKCLFSALRAGGGLWAAESLLRERIPLQDFPLVGKTPIASPAKGFLLCISRSLRIL